jgi:hypothetical protein
VNEDVAGLASTKKSRQALVLLRERPVVNNWNFSQNIYGFL